MDERGRDGPRQQVSGQIWTLADVVRITRNEWGGHDPRTRDVLRLILLADAPKLTFPIGPRQRVFDHAMLEAFNGVQPVAVEGADK